jgi:hypothetical protein
MTLISWRNAALALAAICVWQRYAACTHGEPTTSSSPPPSLEPARAPRATSASTPPAAGAPAPALPVKPRSFHGITIPPVVARFLPQPGEPLRAYRDRVLPVAELVIAPQRARVARIRDELALTPAQRTELDDAVHDCATAIEDRVVAAIASGELDPRTVTPMTGIAVARDVLDAIDKGNTRFQSSLTPDERAAVAARRFDFADYLVFSARWEDALHVLD